MKTYEILVQAYAVIVVSAEDEESALEIAGDCISSSGPFEIDQMAVDGELKTQEAIDSAIRHSEFHRDEHQKTPFTAE